MAVTTTIEDGVAVVTLDDGAHNVLNPAVFDDLRAAFATTREDVTAFVLTGRPGMTTSRGACGS